jgi:hypothetical protein
VRVHPTATSYALATGQRWFTSGAVVRGEVHLLPLVVLRGRGVLERSIRHELVHVMADGALAGRPAWVREGAALYFSLSRPPAGESRRAAGTTGARLSCPRDADLMQPVSPGALNTASAQALACFERQIATGKGWREVK